MKVRFSHLSLSERRKIERWRQMKLSPDEMAHRLGRHRSTIFRELGRVSEVVEIGRRRNLRVN